MEERIRFISHKGKQVLLVDVSNCTPENVSRIARLGPSRLATQPRGSVFLLADFTGSKFDKSCGGKSETGGGL